MFGTSSVYFSAVDRAFILLCTTNLLIYVLTRVAATDFRQCWMHWSRATLLGCSEGSQQSGRYVGRQVRGGMRVKGDYSDTSNSTVPSACDIN